MSRKEPSLTINGIAMPLAAGGEIKQRYEDFGAISLLRLANGAPVHQEAWRKVRSTLTAGGLIPPGLAAIDWKSSFTLGCVAPRGVHAATNTITLPTARRADAAPYGFAFDANGWLRPTAVVLAGDVATLTAVSGAVGYQVLWYPLLTVRAPAGLRASYDAAGAVAGWELECEEV